MKSSDWISVKDRLPDIINKEKDCEFSNEVLLCLQEKEMITAVLAKKNDETLCWLSMLGGYTYPVWFATHWQPIVSPKKEKKWEIQTATEVR
jgi:hypothetical protein